MTRSPLRDTDTINRSGFILLFLPLEHFLEGLSSSVFIIFLKMGHPRFQHIWERNHLIRGAATFPPKITDILGGRARHLYGLKGHLVRVVKNTTTKIFSKHIHSSQISFKYYFNYLHDFFKA